MSSRDQLFQTVLRYIFVLMVLFAVGMGLALIVGVSESVARALITSWSVMFTNTLTFGAGYLVGKGRNGNGHG